MLKRHNVMPTAGGLLDQAAEFVEAVDVIDSEIVALEQRAEKLRGGHGG